MASPQNDSTVVVIVFISFGCLLFLAFFAIALCFFIKKRWIAVCCFLEKRKKKTEQGTDVIHKNEHLKVKEDVVKGPGGTEAVLLTIEDDVHVEEAKWKKEKSGECVVGSSAGKVTRDLNEGTSTSSAGVHQHLEH